MTSLDCTVESSALPSRVAHNSNPESSRTSTRKSVSQKSSSVDDVVACPPSDATFPTLRATSPDASHEAWFEKRSLLRSLARFLSTLPFLRTLITFPLSSGIASTLPLFLSILCEIALFCRQCATLRITSLPDLPWLLISDVESPLLL
jgi:hypothetical protein